MKTKPTLTVPEEVTVVIPVYNESRHIGGVLRVLNQVPDLAQIVVVDDGSRDDSGAVVEKWRAVDSRIELLRLAENQGKGRALMAGARAACHDLLLFLDADLMGLSPSHIPLLTDPVRRGDYHMTIGIFGNGRWQTDLTHRCFPFLSGQRCLRWSLFGEMFEGKRAKWSVETAFGLHAWYNHYPTRYIAWPGVTHALRTEKQESITGLLSHIVMWEEICLYTTRFFLNRGWRSRVERPVKGQRPRSGYGRLASSRFDGHGS